MCFQNFPEVYFLNKKFPGIFNVIQLQNGLVGILNTDRQLGNGVVSIFEIIS
jgi:hypothetical protein